MFRLKIFHTVVYDDYKDHGKGLALSVIPNKIPFDSRKWMALHGFYDAHTRNPLELLAVMHTMEEIEKPGEFGDAVK